MRMIPELTVKVCAGECASENEIDFVMAFQPLVDLAQKRIYGYEALVRGPNGESAMSIISQVTQDKLYAFDQACRVKAIKAAATLGLDRRLSINFLPNAVYHPQSCLKLTLGAALEFNFPPTAITFEFTENEKVMNKDHLKSIVDTYKKFGFLTALDDFGAGYAGLSLLAEFQPDIIKIDRLLVADLHHSRQKQAIVTGVLSTARSLGIDIVAEGVETKEELAALREMGVSKFQGFLFAVPRINALYRDDEIDWG